jgi:hypothetical protein
MPIYRVLDTRIHHDGKPYDPGDTIDLTGEQAAKLRVELRVEGGSSAGKKGKK